MRYGQRIARRKEAVRDIIDHASRPPVRNKKVPEQNHRWDIRVSGASPSWGIPDCRHNATDERPLSARGKSTILDKLLTHSSRCDIQI